MKVTGFDQTCQECSHTTWYGVHEFRVIFWAPTVATSTFTCSACGGLTAVPIPVEIGRELERLGAASTDVPAPLEVLERRRPLHPGLREYELGILQRSSIDHFNERLCAELHEDCE